jgi:hypothetical protein
VTVLERGGGIQCCLPGCFLTGSGFSNRPDPALNRYIPNTYFFLAFSKKKFKKCLKLIFQSKKLKGFEVERPF